MTIKTLSPQGDPSGLWCKTDTSFNAKIFCQSTRLNQSGTESNYLPSMMRCAPSIEPPAKICQSGPRSV